ncbi:unnamed protein product, partial [Vitis vinifera]|uniref:Uncharacterized protein n=1 Tax=Vitis vinifera TaxID=29760 RepID=D7TBV8_VITVI
MSADLSFGILGGGIMWHHVSVALGHAQPSCITPQIPTCIPYASAFSTFYIITVFEFLSNSTQIPQPPQSPSPVKGNPPPILLFFFLCSRTPYRKCFPFPKRSLAHGGRRIQMEMMMAMMDTITPQLRVQKEMEMMTMGIMTTPRPHPWKVLIR